jgi:hypothetical protein
LVNQAWRNSEVLLGFEWPRRIYAMSLLREATGRLQYEGQVWENMLKTSLEISAYGLYEGHTFSDRGLKAYVI